MAFAAAAAGDGLPDPRPGVTDGPGGSAVRAVVDRYGLACQDDRGANGAAEQFCVGTSAGLTLSATFYADPALVLAASASGPDPLARDGITFISDLAGLYCRNDPARLQAVVAQVAAGGANSDVPGFVASGCDVATRVFAAPGNPVTSTVQMTAFATTGAPVAGERNARALPFADAVARPSEVSLDPVVVLESAALAIGVVVLMPFPGQLFNSTLEEHEADVRRWLRLDRLGRAAAGFGAWSASWPGIVAFTLAAALLYSLLDPTFGVDLHSLATFIGMLAGIVVVTVAFAVPAWLVHRRAGDAARIKIVPVSLLVGIACVAISRVTGFEPGYLYGLLIGLAFARELSASLEARLTAIGALLMLVTALAAWVVLGALPVGDAFLLVALRTALAALMVAGLEGVVFGLLPMRFLPGEAIYAWNRTVWAAILASGAFTFFHILVNPASGYLSDSTRTPLVTVLALFVGFGLISVGFWAWFRFRSPGKATA